MSNVNKPVPGATDYYPLNEPAIGTPLVPDGEVPLLFKPMSIRGVTFKNRIFVSPMCQYSSHDGHATDWHLVHLGGFATRGAGAVCVEASAVVPEGRISPEDNGIWSDTQIPMLKKIVDFCHAQGTVIGIQLAHAGRKASTLAPWVKLKAGSGSTYISQENEGGWPNDVVGPSHLPFSDRYPPVKELTESQLKDIEEAFVAAIRRVETAGFDFIEIHGAHGYLFSSFLSPLSNTREDKYGGQPLANRMRFPLQIVERVRAEWSKPLFVRISATEWDEGPEQGPDDTWNSWGIEQSKIFVGELQKVGIDLLDCSSGGNYVHQKIPLGPGYQVPFAEALKRTYPSLLVGAVGLITEPQQAESYLQDKKADVVFLARELLRHPHWPLMAAQQLGVHIQVANQHQRAWEWHYKL